MKNANIYQLMQYQKELSRLTISFHFFIVSRFPRLNVALRALAEKLRDDRVSDILGLLGQMLTIINVIELPPAYRITTWS